MNMQHTAILSLGSNMGNRLENIQDAIAHLHAHIATVVKTSGIYQTPAWGFEGDAFYNCALLVHTGKTAHELLEVILDAEARGGRTRIEGSGYISRTIDVDIIAFDDDVVNEPHLHIPHPRMHQRNFVLYPLRDLNPRWVHPVLKEDINRLIELSGDESPCEFIMKLPEPLESSTLHKFGYIAIEGNIGAGKTSLATKISEDFNAKLVLERFADNPFLPKFYEDPQRFAFSLEMSFLAERYRQLTDDLAQLNLFSDFVVADYHSVKSLIFARVTLGEDEYRLYRRLFDILYKEIPRPGLYVYLYQNSQALLGNIKKRGRDYEQDISADYLENINRGYLDYIRSTTGLNILLLDITGRDFVNRQEDYIWVLEQLQNAPVK
ncbi:7,8-dihydro-6-hydroxymethylpterin-pyrophosphokinase [Flavobacterium akiainvivens]|uniref:2-amino-4-hydroxy-6-hydroxymethyldihydropteridine pyrophosphokinase n=1 Tax=Flavobacterium akiainvivens TaxID=1202724 RepID=A0A0M9VIE2_9FLAO|nr:2-amino-4-hydroxy-6-hydroxymethyldihydropteridine diphosphokinase [Flavobacterium akiainvivens]KOS06596.1 7,8-dihydro-6-hydroxymethylpterin-pyrophosphokinase [Flavobacterium akiainvivens]